MEEQPTDLAALLPGIAGQMRGLLSNLYLAAAQAIPAERREQDNSETRRRKNRAGRGPAAFFAEWPLSDPAMRPTRSVTASA